MATQRLRRGAERKVVARLRRVVLVCLMACAHWGGVPVRAATSASGLDIPSALFFAPQPRIRFPAGETPHLGKTLDPFLPRAYRKYYQKWRWRWRRADSSQPASQEVETVADRGSSYVVRADDMGRFLSACVQIAVAPDIVPWYCTDFVGPATNPVPASMLDIPPVLALGPQLTWIRRDLNPGQEIAVSLLPPQNAYRVSGWRWRRADSPRPAPQDTETVARYSSYVVQADDAGRFLSACVQIAIVRDISSEYCTDFVGPVTNSNSPCASFKPPPVTRGRWRLVPALDGCRWNFLVTMLPWPDGGWLIAEQLGRILHHRPGQVPRLLLDLTAEVGRLGRGNGLLNLALDPQFPTRPFIYVYYARGIGADAAISRLARFPVADGRIRREAELILLEETTPQRAGAHFGGGLGFGPDNLLYLGVGDGHAPAQAQRPGSLRGKILRLDVRCGAPGRAYCIPAANPWRGQATARPEVYARGFRNPWRLAFDPQDGTLWVADVGEAAREEVNRVQAGGNHGWPLWEGDLCRTGPVACAEIAHAPPVATYAHDAQGGCAVIGGVVYRGTALPGLDGAYLFGDHCSGRVWALTPRAENDGRMRLLMRIEAPGLRLIAFVAHGDAIYLLMADGFDSTVWQLVPA